MKYISIKEWLDNDKIKMLIYESEIKKLKADYKYIYKDGPPVYFNENDVSSIEFKTGFPLAEEYYEDITSNDQYLDAIETQKDYLSFFAECILKVQILSACQLFYKFPLWQDSKLLEWEKPIKESLEKLYNDAKQNDDQFVFPQFFPYFSNEYVLHPRFMLKWIYSVINEFFYIAENNLYHLTPEEKEKKRAETRKELQILEDLLTGKSKELK